MNESKKGNLKADRTHAHVKIYKWLYNAVPFAFWQAFWLERHLSRCPKCLDAWGPVEEKPMEPVGITPARAEPLAPQDLWYRVKTDAETGFSPPAPRERRVWRWRMALVPAAAAILLLAVLFIPEKGTGKKISEVQVENRDIIIRYVNVDHRPAEAVYVQPGDDDRVIVWVKKPQTEVL